MVCPSQDFPYQPISRRRCDTFSTSYLFTSLLYNFLAIFQVSIYGIA
nr:MAG TPA: hypothetical protein [Caudoviricetes sp.]